MTRSEALFSRLEVDKSKEELAQYRRDRQSWEERLDRSGRRTGTASWRRSPPATAIPQPHRFPVAVVFVVPRREAIR